MKKTYLVIIYSIALVSLSGCYNSSTDTSMKTKSSQIGDCNKDECSCNNSCSCSDQCACKCNT